MLKKIFKYSVGALLLFTLVFTAYTLLTLLLFKFIDPPTTAFIQQRNNEQFIKIIYPNSVSQYWVPIKSISDNLIFAVIASEDQRFTEHFGIDFEEVQNVFEKAIDGKKVRGASTITQQTAKNLFLFPHKNIFRKGIEAYYSVMIELIWSKKRIMEVYLNIAQFGENIYGVEAASKFYFNKPAQYLNIKEASQLVSILPNPLKFNLNNKSKYLKKRITRIINTTNFINKKEILKKLGK